MRKKEFLKKSIATLLAMSIAFTSGSMPGVFAAEQEENAGTSRTTTEVASPQEEAPEEVVVKSQEDEAPEEGGSDASSTETVVETAPTADTEKPAAKAEPANENTDEAGTDAAAKTEEVTTGETTEGEKPAEEQKEEKKYFFRINLDGAGIVKVILSSDEGAGKDDPSAAISKDAEGKAEKKTRNDYVDKAIVNEDGTDLAFELTEGEKIEVITETPEGFKVSEYRITTDSGAEIEADPSSWEYTLTEDTALKVVVEKEPEKEEKGSVAVKVGSAGGTVTVTNGETSYTVVKAEDGTVTVTDQDGNAVKSESEFDLVVEDEIGKTISVKAAADQGAHVTAFAVAAGETAEESAFKAEDKPAEFAQDIEIAQGQKVVTVAFIAMPEFTAEQTVGKYIVKVHAAAGILPAGTVAEIRELSDEEAKPLVKETEKTAGGEVVAAIDITFKDAEGKEVQPAGMVEVTFDNAVEDGLEMSVVHAVDGKTDKLETVPSDTEGDSVKFQSDSFSPFLLTASAAEPGSNWTKGGGGISDNIKDQIAVIHKKQYEIIYTPYDFYDSDSGAAGVTFSYEMYVGDELVGTSVCLSPNDWGPGLDGVPAGEVYEVSAPMFVKALYYGPYGPGSDVIRKVTGYTQIGALNIIAHVAAAEIYARLGYGNAHPGDALAPASETLKNAVYKYVNYIANQPTPSGYYGYTTEKNGSSSQGYKRQNFGFGSFALTNGSAQVKKVSSAPEMTNGNSCYSLKGAKYWIYTSEATARAKGDAGRVSGGTLITDETGVSGTFTIAPGTYWMIEGEAPEGFKLNPEPVKFTVTRGETTTVNVSDVAANDSVAVVIQKKCNNTVEGMKINSLEGTEFTLKYYNGHYNASTLPETATRTWVIKVLKTEEGLFRALLDDEHFVSGDSFYRDGNNNIILPLGTITIEETKAADGYINDGTFGDDATMYIGQIVADPTTETGAKCVDIQGKRNTDNTFEVGDTSKTPSIVKTTAKDVLSGSHSAFPGTEVELEDEVVYENLIVDEKYTLKGELMDKNTGRVIKDADGNPVTAEKTFTAKTIDGTVTINFKFKAGANFRGKTTVVFETITCEGRDPITHADITDEAQTIRFPKISTTAVGSETEEHLVLADEDAKIDDTVTYENLVVGQEYTLKGVVMDKATGKPLLVNGEEVRAEKTFTPDENNSSEVISFTFDASDLAGKALVVFEELYVGETLVAEHEDIKDLGQTVTVPNVITDAYDKTTGKKNTLAAEDQVVIDKISYDKLIAGKTYKVSGEVKIKDEDAENFDDAETVPSVIVAATGNGSIIFDDEEVTFTPYGTEGEIVSGELIVSFKVDGSYLAGEEIVVGETVKYKGKKVAVHRDINDDRQTDYVPDGKTTAIDKETGIKNTLAAENRVFKDTFEYTKLLPGETYRFTGKVMVTKTDEEGNPVVDADGKTVVEEIPSFMTDENGNPVPNGYVEFVPEGTDDEKTVNGTLDLYFSIDASELENKDVTVFERVTLKGEPVIVHEVLDGTQTVYIPEGQTTAIDSETQDQIAFPDEEVSIIDTFFFKNLIPGTEYTLDGRVMLKGTGEEIESALTEAEFAQADGTETTGTISVADNVVTFTPDQKNGAIKLTFVIDGSNLAGEDTVIFERSYHNGKEVIIHENIDDKNQTVQYPDGHTQAADPDTDDRTMMAKGEVLIKDSVFYENVLPGHEYVLTGKVMLKPLGEEEPVELEARMVDADGNDIDEWVFTAENKDGVEDVYFMINADELAGRSVVMFENMDVIHPELETRATIFTHEDINDDEQTVHFPDGRTTALDSDTGSHTSYADEEVTINDEVIFKNLIPGKTYTLDGILYDKETGKPLIVDGKEVTAHKEFVPETADGSTIVEFTFNGLGLAGKTVVAGETVKSNGKEVFIHFDLNDEDQTVRFPKVRTTAVDKKDGDHEISYKGTETIVDTVSYENVYVGNKYHVYGVLMNKTTGQPAKAGGKEIVGDATFVAKDTKGTVQVTFRFNAADLKAGDYVVFETLYEVNAETGDEKPVASHSDLNDKSQTVRRPPTPSGSRTGDENMPFVWIAVLAASCMAAFGIYASKRRKG